MSHLPFGGLTFVPLAEEHLKEVLAIEKEAYAEAWTLGMFRQEIRSVMSSFYVAYLDDTLIGYVGLWKVLEEAHITSVTIRKEYRGQGYGRILVSFILSLAANSGLTEATLEVRESNAPAIHLYETMGFQRTGLRKGYYAKTNENAIVMARPLEPATTQTSAHPA